MEKKYGLVLIRRQRMKLAVGMYVRTDGGKIGKLRRELKDYYELEYPRVVLF